MSQTTTQKTNLSFAVASILILGIGATAYMSAQRFINDSQWVTHTVEVQVNLNDLSERITKSQDYLSQFFRTKDLVAFERFQTTSSSILPLLVSIKALTADNLSQQQNIEELNPLINRQMKRWNVQALSGGRERWSSQDTSLLDAIDKRIDGMYNHEAQLLKQRISKSNSASEIMILLIFIGTALAIALIVLAVSIVNRELSRRVAAESLSESNRKKAEQAALTQAQFLANMSHEIRTPLNGIIGVTDLALDTELTETQHKYLKIIRESGCGLLTIVNDILDFSKMDAGKLELEIIPFDLRQLIESQVELIAPRARQKDLGLRIQIDPDIPANLKGDPGRIAQVLLNLIGNAIKFTPKGSVIISVAMEERNGTHVVLKFSVQDTGIGISKEAKEKLFRPFTQADGSTARKFGGTGLGLSICKRLTQLMNGSIGVESVKEQGSTFWFTCRVSTSAHSTIQICPVHRLATQKTETQNSGRILVVEDNAVNQILVLAQLKKLGFIGHAVANGREAIAALEHGPYHVILMDCQMPEMDGFEATVKIRELEASRGTHTPIIALTANALKEDEARCLHAGMDEYLAKPVKLDELADAIQRWLSTELGKVSA
jgi:signal transduction histidine kinase/CheY-like chemotaxis protein